MVSTIGNWVSLKQSSPNKSITHDSFMVDLACDNRLFDGIKRITWIDNKVSIGNNLFNQPPYPVQRGTKTIKITKVLPVEYEPVSTEQMKYGTTWINRPNKESKRSTGQDPISVSVVHCDLKYASYAWSWRVILVEKLLPDQKALDNYYEGKINGTKSDRKLSCTGR